MAGLTSMAEPATFTREDHPSLSRNLEAILRESKSKEVEGLTAAKDWADFQRRRGVIDGIDQAISICQRENRKLQG